MSLAERKQAMLRVEIKPLKREEGLALVTASVAAAILPSSACISVDSAVYTELKLTCDFHTCWFIAMYQLCLSYRIYLVYFKMPKCFGSWVKIVYVCRCVCGGVVGVGHVKCPTPTTPSPHCILPCSKMWAAKFWFETGNWTTTELELVSVTQTNCRLKKHSPRQRNWLTLLILKHRTTEG